MLGEVDDMVWYGVHGIWGWEVDYKEECWLWTGGDGEFLFCFGWRCEVETAEHRCEYSH